MNNNIFSQEVVSILKIGFAQLLASIIFISSGVLNIKRNRRFGLLLLTVGLLFVTLTFLFDKGMVAENSIPLRTSLLPATLGMFMLGIPPLVIGIPLMFFGISKISQPQSRNSGILYIVLAGALIFTFVWFLIIFAGSEM